MYTAGHPSGARQVWLHTRTAAGDERISLGPGSPARGEPTPATARALNLALAGMAAYPRDAAIPALFAALFESERIDGERVRIEVIETRLEAAGLRSTLLYASPWQSIPAPPGDADG